MCEYVMFVDADDLLMPRAVEVLSREIKINNADIAASDYLTEKESHMAELSDPRIKSITWLHGKIYRRQYLVDNNIRFLPQFKFNEDSYFNLVAWNCTKNTIKINEALYIWRFNKNSVTRSVSGKELHERVMSTYVDTQILALQKIIDTVGDIKTVTYAATLLNIYLHIMRAHFYKITSNDYEKNFYILRENKILQSKFNYPEFWNYLIIHTTQGSTAENTFFFYKENIFDFLDKNIIVKE